MQLFQPHSQDQRNVVPTTLIPSLHAIIQKDIFETTYLLLLESIEKDLVAMKSVPKGFKFLG